MISYVIEMTGILEKYKKHIFGPALDEYRKHPLMDNTVLLSDKLRISGDMPEDTAINEVINPEKNLCAIVSLFELSSSRAWAQYGDTSSVGRTPISMTVWTSDPILREEIHISMTEFFMKNGATIVHGKSKTGMNWELDHLAVHGYGQSPEGLYNRIYTLFMRSIWVPAHERRG